METEEKNPDSNKGPGGIDTKKKYFLGNAMVILIQVREMALTHGINLDITAKIDLSKHPEYKELNHELFESIFPPK